MASPTIAAAAASLRICPSALSHQLRRLERDIGAKLYQPATTRRPWQPTRLEQVNDAFGPISQRSARGKVALDTTAWGAWRSAGCSQWKARTGTQA